MKKTEPIHVRAGHDRSYEFNLCTHICLCLTKQDASEFLKTYGDSFPDSGRLSLLVLGLIPDKKNIQRIKGYLNKKKLLLAVPDDLAGHAAAIKIACLLKSWPVALVAMADGFIAINCSHKRLKIPAQDLSLSRFERLSGFRSCMRVYKLKP